MLKNQKSGEGHGALLIILVLLLAVFALLGFLTFHVADSNEHPSEARNAGAAQY